MDKLQRLREHVFIDDSGKTVRQFVDPDGVIIEQYKLVQQWVRESDQKQTSKEDEPRLGRNPEHIKLYRTNIQYILAKENLSKNARVTLLSCVAYLDWNNNIVVDSRTGEPLNGKEIAERTNLSKNIVSMGLRELQSKGIIYITGATKNSRQYVVNPSVAWKGNRVAKDIAQAMHFNKHGLKLPVNIKYTQGSIL